MITEGPINCYWCDVEIPYTINQGYWYCWNCRKYTRNSKIGTERKSHSCGVREVIDPDHSIVMLECVSKDPYPCPNTLITLTQIEYQFKLKEEQTKDSWNTREWHDNIQARIQEYHSKEATKRREIKASHPILKDKESEAYKRAFAAFEAKEERKRQRKIERKANR